MAPSSETNRGTVIQVVPQLGTGGAERTAIDIANALANAGFGSVVVSEGGRMATQLDQRVKQIVLPVASKNPLTIARNASLIGRIVREQKPGLIHARSRACAWSAMMAARGENIPWATTYHGIYNAKNPFKHFYNSIMVRADAVIANSEWTARHISETYRRPVKRLTVIPRGIDVAHFDPAQVSRERVAAMRAGWTMREGDRVVLLPGRLARWKGQLVFIDAMARLLHAMRLAANVRPVLVGDSQGRFDYLDELKQAIAQSGLGGVAVIAGHAEDMPAAYAAADVVVSASTDPEAFGRVSAEAGAMARPVIATDHGGARETVLAGVSGLLVSPGEAAALAEAIADLLARPPTALAAMGKAGRTHITAHYTVERMCEQTLALYRQLMG
jgi:glycosyltransferase involved in cell wall biosynthesis